MPNTTDYEFGDVVPVAFPFTDQTASKKRPAVVVSSSAYNRQRPDVVLTAATSQAKSTAYFGDIPANDWQQAGLLKPSLIKPIFTTIEKGLVLRKPGRPQ
jgi:mRNA interferase MazF